MVQSEILYSLSNGVATITLNRPSRGNALTLAMNQAILNLLPVLASDPTVRVLILTGAGRYFCTGMDLGAAINIGANNSPHSPSKQQEHNPSNGFQAGLDVFDALYRFPKPLIARINGPCLGGGVGLVFVADIRIATNTAYFALTEVKRGIVPAIISQYLVPELGSLRAREYMLTGRQISTTEAHFLSAVVPQDQLDTKVQAYCQMLISSAPQAMADIKQLIHTVASRANPTNDDNVRLEVNKVYTNMMQSDEAAYGIQAFLNKQTPDWTAYLKKKSKL
ncbi:hypothetical protein PHYBLDRAFT_167409 [Phycomyces blakesleeanus NRRL 1555(-)]|uniref:Enoyl-CoA hydratase n=2 Tax=Phycomyces blakesleeanus TaxID=4837 RepID=A0A167N5Y4_PHYB8|nr:hypothetical protein PHYBLDRAFT_167409 [Phycomyces blakesleeanus NRRL 1555(-)]OAD75089.1 hypothetical protein PHYBLDRAFT_167409 [Phycomyces blakesleeanus NRRL 1555(-)]|eukprot:XP_018293129.1 hypothetical protein PHYBLDRAFT_167409 [Phycomyces blakesleeanus NRRL 1555(-)]